MTLFFKMYNLFFSRYIFFVSLKKSIAINNAFQIVLDISNRKSKRVWIIYKCNEICNRIMQTCLQDKIIEINSAQKS